MVMTAYAAGMGDVVLQERLPALWRRIEDAHYIYLETDDCPEKLQQKNKLESLIMEYLTLVPHEFKFGLSETAKVFQRTLNELPEFSAYRAGLGWAALARYAANLLAQPWRKEYKVIRLYCGYFKHEVEANMVGADTLLQAMGYKPVGGGRLALDTPVCPDMVTAISRDALIAQCECQIMAHIWESVWSSGTRVTWAEVARARAGRPTAGSVKYGDGSEIYSNTQSSVISEPLLHRQDVRYPNSILLPTCNHICSEVSVEEPMTHSAMTHPAYMSNMLPSQIMYRVPHHIHSDVPATISHCSQVPVMPAYNTVPYYCPVQGPYMIPTPVYAPIKQASTIPVNGYPPTPQYRYPSVPTGQLIEFDTPSIYENGHDKQERLRDDDRIKKSGRTLEISRRNSSKSGFSDVSIPSMPRSDTQPTLSKAKEDGMGTYESWDYVFRNLSSKDNVDNRSRFSPSLDRDSRTLDRLDRDERRTKYQPTTLDLEDGLEALNLDRSYDEDAYRTAKVNENLMRLKQEQEFKKAKQLAKRQTEEKKLKKYVEPVGNPKSDGLIVSKVAPDKVRLLSKKEVKDRKDIIKQQNGSLPIEIKKVKKPVIQNSVAVELEKPSKNKPLVNGLQNAHSSKNVIVPNATQPNYDLKAQLIVTLDETDSVRRSPPKPKQNGYSGASNQLGDREKRHAVDVTAKRDRWECATCTYLNRLSLVACEMCGKSKKGPEIEPLKSGGRECPMCTLVNGRDAHVCDACGESLEHCPTYI